MKFVCVVLNLQSETSFVGHALAIVYAPVRASVIGLNKSEGALLLSILGIVR